MGYNKRILWVDDEVQMLLPHHLFLEKKGYHISTATNGDDALALVKDNHFDLILLDEMMPGKGGLETLAELKKIRPYLPVIMVTRNEAEDILDQAIGKQIDGYLLKPVHPMQVLSACKQILDKKQIQENRLPPDYVQNFSELSQKINDDLDWKDWISLYREIIRWDLNLENQPQNGLRSTHADLQKEANNTFISYIRKHYPAWMKGKNPPPLSPDIFPRFVFPELKRNKRIFLIILDCMSLDLWMIIEPMIKPFFAIETDYYYSVLPTATPYARNAIFAGIFPDQIAQKYPDFWVEQTDDDSSRNAFEADLLTAQASRHQILAADQIRYFKANNQEDIQQFMKKLDYYLSQPLSALVINFLDILTHSRADSQIIKELSHNVSAWRAVFKTWFSHSNLFALLKELSDSDHTVIITSDHGAILCRHATKVIGDRATSTNLRYKFGSNLQCDEKAVLRIRHPEEYHLPADSFNKNYLIATSDYYFVYPTNFHQYQKFYWDSFQHGGISMEEMILPLITLTRLQR